MVSFVGKIFTQRIRLTFIITSYFPSSQVLPNCPSKHVLGYEQCTYEQRKAMLGKRENRVPYPSLKTVPRLSPFRTRNIRMHGDPCTRENRDKTTPNNIPYSSTVGEVGARVRIERATVDRVGADRVSQVVDEEEK